MDFQKFSNYLARLEATASRNQIIEILADLFKTASVEEINKICYLSLGQLLPSYKGLEFNLAERMMIKVLACAFKIDAKEILVKFKNSGDLGEIAQNLKQGQKKSFTNFSVTEVYQKLYQIAVEGGSGSVERKVNQMAELLIQVDPVSAKYLVRIPISKLRLGFSELTILDALSWLLQKDKFQRKFIEAAYNVQADVGLIARIIKKSGLKGLKAIRIKLGIPVVPALCQRLPNAQEMVKKMGRMAVEPKYDGTRLQIHWQKNKVSIFTRNLENVTEMFPDLTRALNKQIKAKSAIFDGEAIAFNPRTGKLLPFQETIKRKRKYEIGAKSKEIPLKYFVFDLLYKDGVDLLNHPLSERRKLLVKLVSKADLKQLRTQTIILSPQILTDNSKELKQYHDQQIKAGLEGVVAKKWESVYDPGRRGYTWVKLKQEKGKKGGGLADTLDCVVMGYYKGKGKRAGFGIGGFLVGLKNNQKVVTVSKIGTGLSDDQWREMRLRADKVATLSLPKSYVIDKNLLPDVICLPKIIVEIEADNITKSPIHKAGLALRFPRLVRFRDDKSFTQATTVEEAQKLYDLQ